jgi:RNA polymerase sigma-70 factor (ECF subfamily)
MMLLKILPLDLLFAILQVNACSDDEIIQRIKVEGFQAYGTLVRRYNQRMFRIAWSIITNDATAMDSVQDTHIQAYTKLDSFKGNGTFAAWIAGITRNQALMHLRKNKREITMGDDESKLVEKIKQGQERTAKDRQPDKVLQNFHMKELINENLDKLSENFRSVFVLRAVEQFSTKETAKILKINEITVKTRYFRSKRFLRHAIQDYLDTSNMKLYEFGNRNCGIVLFNVLTELSELKV